MVASDSWPDVDYGGSRAQLTRVPVRTTLGTPINGPSHRCFVKTNKIKEANHAGLFGFFLWEN